MLTHVCAHISNGLNTISISTESDHYGTLQIIFTEFQTNFIINNKCSYYLSVFLFHIIHFDYILITWYYTPYSIYDTELMLTSWIWINRVFFFRSNVFGMSIVYNLGIWNHNRVWNITHQPIYIITIWCLPIKAELIYV